MVFSDPIFLVLFLPLAVLLYRSAVRYSGYETAQWILILSSLVFYAFWRVEWLALLAGSVVFNFWLGRQLFERPRRPLLVFGIFVNLLPLAICKYAGWLTGLDYFLSIALPLGISFFTFQQIAYLVDAYKRTTRGELFRHYALFVAFWPQLVAGPIVHHKEMISQFRSPIHPGPETTFRALFLLSAGLFKKVVIADNLAPYANVVFDGTGVVSVYEAWTGALAYTLQLYFDFSGYCEMAMGLALLFGIALPINFNSPYRSRSISEFWRRWHITLGRWFRAYCYIPLGGNRHGAARLYFALVITALLSGIWHGAGLNFIVWGFIHGLALVMHKAWSASGRSMNDSSALIVMVFFAIFSWVVFRAPTLDVALSVWASMFGANGFVHVPLTAQIVGSTSPVLNTITGLELPIMVLLMWYCATQPNVHQIHPLPSRRLAFGYVASTVVVFFSITSVSDFIYWSF